MRLLISVEPDVQGPLTIIASVPQLLVDTESRSDVVASLTTETRRIELISRQLGALLPSLLSMSPELWQQIIPDGDHQLQLTVMDAGPADALAALAGAGQVTGHGASGVASGRTGCEKEGAEQ